MFEGEQVPLLAVTLEHTLHAKGEGSAHLAGLFADEDAVAFGVLAGHDQPEALPKDALNALEGHLRGFAGVGVEHREGFAGVEDQTDGVEVTAAKEQVVTDVVVITRVVAAQHLAWEGEPSTAKRHGDVESCLFEAFAKGGEKVKVLDGADQSKFHVGQSRGSPDGIEEALLRFFFGQGSIAASFEALPRTFTVGVKDGQDGLDFRVAFVGHINELRGHARIDVHLRVAHVRDQFHAHHLHLVVHQIASTVTRIGGEHHFRAGVGFDGVHHFQRLHLESLGYLQGDETVVAVFDARHQLLELEIVTVEVHVAPDARHAIRFSSHARRCTRDDPSVHHIHRDEGRQVEHRVITVQVGHSGAFLNDDDHLCDFRAAPSNAVDDRT